MMSDDDLKREQIKDLHIVKREMFGRVKHEHLESFLEVVMNPALDDEQRKTLLNSFDGDGWNVLHFAASHRKAESIAWLLSDEGRAAGFNSVLAEGEDGCNALHYAAWWRNHEEFHAIVNGCRVDNGERREMLNAVGDSGVTVLHYAALRGDNEIVTWILSDEEGGGRAAGFDRVLAKSNEGRSALHSAARHGYLETCKAIVNGCREDNGERQEMFAAVDEYGWTVLHVAAWYGKANVVAWLLSNDEGGGRALGFDKVLAKSKNGLTALHAGARYGCLDSCKAIVNACQVDNGEQQEMLNAVDKDGSTVLHCAVRAENPDLITWILTEGVAAGFDRNNITALMKDGSSCLHLATVTSGDNVRTLLSHCSNKEKMNLFLFVDHRGWTALRYAARKDRGGEIIVELLQYPECALIVNRKDDLGMTVLHQLILDEKSRHQWPHTCKSNLPIITSMIGGIPSLAVAVDPNIGIGGV